MSKYIVEYIQVNINVGDCEIILLLEEKAGKKSIKYSVMVDGGMGNSVPMANIRRVFANIERKYVFPRAFQLDAIVITHWDEDHYGGIFELLKNPWYMSGKTSRNPLKKKGQTRLYVPYEPLGRASFDPCFKLFRIDGELRSKDGKTIICKYLDDMPKGQTALLEAAPEAWDFDEKNSQLIGRNLFTNFRPTLDQGNTANPTALVGAHSAKMPGLYCVAANNRFLGQGTGDATKNTTPKNRSSIVCMVIHPDGTMSHYLAGDAHKEIEAKVIEWTGLETPADLSKPIVGPVDNKDRIAIVKASHHGSFTATPIEMCQTYKPKYFVFSAGNLHHHPMWEVLLYVCSYYRSLGKNISLKIDGQYGVLMTSFPYWMHKGVEHFLPPKKPQQPVEKYREIIEQFFGKERKHVRKLYETVIEAKAKADEIKAAKISTKEAEAKKAKREIEEKIIEMFKPILSNCSPIRDDNYVFPDKQGMLTSHVSYISFLLDGDVYVDVDRRGVKFDRLPTKRAHSATPGPSGGGAPKKKRGLPLMRLIP